MTSGIALFFTGMPYDALHGGKKVTKYLEGNGTSPRNKYGALKITHNTTTTKNGQNLFVKFFVSIYKYLVSGIWYLLIFIPNTKYYMPDTKY